MNTRQKTMEYRMTRWAEIIRDRSASGETVKDYCERKGIGKDTYYYWLRKLRENAYEQITELQSKPTGLAVQGFTEVKHAEPYIPPKSTITNQLYIETGTLKLTVGCEYPVEHLTKLLRELPKPC